MKAVIIKEQGVAAVANIEERPLRPDYIRVKTVCLAVNPTDLHHTATAGVGRVGGIIGCDFSGIVEEVGPKCSESNVKKGDAVYGVCHGANLSCEADGAFAEFVQVRDGHLAKIPQGISFEEAATLGVGITTIGQTLYMTMKLPLPYENDVELKVDTKRSAFVLIYGGSSATGTLAIQFANLSGLTVVTTASPENFDLLKARGAHAIFDYHDPGVAQKIRDFTKNSLCYVLDCVSTEASYRVIAETLPEKGPHYVVTLLPADNWPRKDVEVTTILAYTTLGKPFSKFGIDFPAIPSHFEFGVKFWRLSQRLLAEGKIRPHPVALRKGGLAGIPSGLAEHAGGNVRAFKLVYKVLDNGDVVPADNDNVINAPELGAKW